MTPTRDRERAAATLRADILRTQQLAREAVDALDIAVGIAHLRGLRSLIWRAQNLKIDLTEPATFAESSED